MVHSLPWTAYLLGAVAAGANVFGGIVITARNWERRYVRYFVALGAGFMVGVTLTEMVPESLHRNPSSGPLLLIIGFLLVHLVEHSIVSHFHFGEETHAEEFSHGHIPYSVLTGLGIHTFFDGVAIGSGFLISDWLGWMLFFAVFMHKIPEGVTIASVMLAAGKTRSVALLSALGLGICSIAGVLLMALFPLGLPYTFPLAAGVTLYVAATDLLPEVNREPGIAMASLVFLGAGLLFALRYIFGGGV